MQAVKRVRSAAAKKIAFVCEETDISVERLPEDLRSVIVVGNTIDRFNVADIDAVVWKPPGDAQVVSELFKQVEQATGEPPRWLHSFYAGVDGLQQVEVDSNKTVTTNGRGAFSASLAEFNLAAMLHFTKQLPRVERNREQKHWEKFEMDMIQGKTVGFLGWGSIAQSTAKLLGPFGIKRPLCIRRNASQLSDGLECVSTKLELAQRSDFVINTLPGTRETLDFVDAEFLANMKPNAVLINVGRGSTVDENALVEALRANRIRGAHLDVFKTEPLPPSSALYECPNLLLTNHNADHTNDYVELGWQVFENNYQLFLDDFAHGAATAVDLKRGY